MNDINTAVRVLNEAFAADPNAMNQMFGNQWACNDTLANHPTIQVAGGDDQPHLGVIGLINGILEPMTGEKAAACYGENGLEGFQIYISTQS